MPLFLTLFCVLVLRQVDTLIPFVNALLMFLILVYAISNDGDPASTTSAAPGYWILASYLPFLAVGVLATIASTYIASSFYSLFKEMLFLLLMLGLYRAIRLLPNGIDSFMDTLMAVGIVASASVIGEGMYLLLNARSQSLGADLRASGVFGNPSAPGHLFSVIAPLYYAYNRIIKQNQGATFLLWLCGVALLFTQSRSGIVAYFASVGAVKIYLADRSTRLRIASIMAAGLVAVVLLLLSFVGLEDLTLVLRIANGLSGREELWERGWQVFVANPVLGVGLDSFRYEFLGYSDQSENVRVANQILASYALSGDTEGFDPSVFGAVIGNSTHNLFLDVAVTTGIAGLLGLAYFIYAVSSRLAYCDFGGHSGQQFARACLLIFVVFLMRAQVEPVGLIKGAISSNIPIWMLILSPFVVRNESTADVLPSM
jgi:O-antigen ligase